MISFRDLSRAIRELSIDREAPVMVHSSLSAFGEPVQGGAETVLGALTGNFRSVVMPTFTYKTMVIPEVGPPDNALNYDKGRFTSRRAEIFDPDMPADPLMGVVAEALRSQPKAQRSLHPILSFSGLNAAPALKAQSYAEPLAPVEVTLKADGWVLLIGVDHTVNTSLHYAERLAGRKQFVRWALTRHGVRECPGFPGCSEGFEAIAPRLEGVTRSAVIGQARLRAVPLEALIETGRAWIAEDPQALLCDRDFCARCSAVRHALLSAA